MGNNDLSQETKDKLEIARSKVRRIVTYVMTGTLALGLLYSLMWMGDRSALTGITTIGTAVIGYYFGWRSGQTSK